MLRCRTRGRESTWRSARTCSRPRTRADTGRRRRRCRTACRRIAESSTSPQPCISDRSCSHNRSSRCCSFRWGRRTGCRKIHPIDTAPAGTRNPSCTSRTFRRSRRCRTPCQRNWGGSTSSRSTGRRSSTCNRWGTRRSPLSPSGRTCRRHMTASRCSDPHRRGTPIRRRLRRCRRNHLRRTACRRSSGRSRPPRYTGRLRSRSRSGTTRTFHRRRTACCRNMLAPRSDQTGICSQSRSGRSRACRRIRSAPCRNRCADPRTFYRPACRHPPMSPHRHRSPLIRPLRRSFPPHRPRIRSRNRLPQQRRDRPSRQEIPEPNPSLSTPKIRAYHEIPGVRKRSSPASNSKELRRSDIGVDGCRPRESVESFTSATVRGGCRLSNRQVE